MTCARLRGGGSAAIIKAIRAAGASPAITAIMLWTRKFGGLEFIIMAIDTGSVWINFEQNQGQKQNHHLQQ
jgi:hypothetical protein